MCYVLCACADKNNVPVITLQTDFKHNFLKNDDAVEYVDSLNSRVNVDIGELGDSLTFVHIIAPDGIFWGNIDSGEEVISLDSNKLNNVITGATTFIIAKGTYIISIGYRSEKKSNDGIKPVHMIKLVVYQNC